MEPAEAKEILMGPTRPDPETLEAALDAAQHLPQEEFDEIFTKGHPWDPPVLSYEEARKDFAGFAETIKRGEDARQARRAMIQVLHERGWSEADLAEVSGLTQQAINKTITRDDDDVPPPHYPEPADAAVIMGRLLGLGQHLLHRPVFMGTLTSARIVEKYSERPYASAGRIQQLVTLLTKDIRPRKGIRLPPIYREQLQEITEMITRTELPQDPLGPEAHSRLLLALSRQANYLNKAVRNRRKTPRSS